MSFTNPQDQPDEAKMQLSITFDWDERPETSGDLLSGAVTMISNVNVPNDMVPPLLVRALEQFISQEIRAGLRDRMPLIDDETLENAVALNARIGAFDIVAHTPLGATASVFDEFDTTDIHFPEG